MISTVLAITLAKAIDPIIIIAVVLLVAFVRNAYVRLLGALAIGVGYQLLAVGLSGNNAWHLSGQSLIAAILAALLWLSIAPVVRNFLRWIETNFPTQQPMRGVALALLWVVAFASVTVGPMAVVGLLKAPAQQLQ